MLQYSIDLNVNLRHFSTLVGVLFMDASIFTNSDQVVILLMRRYRAVLVTPSLLIITLTV